ncbi:9700_t:CDS:2 [Diversispora eburnea]|uniref:9700_t:CDS:1 n=1 Tax=Diversispora eburnea TaxID=1213867 RepID=A0A9N9B7Q7_9GLOM|nr:9700_t:CDS:2 [Diversispora eburnea]
MIIVVPDTGPHFPENSDSNVNSRMATPKTASPSHSPYLSSFHIFPVAREELLRRGYSKEWFKYCMTDNPMKEWKDS